MLEHALSGKVQVHAHLTHTRMQMHGEKRWTGVTGEQSEKNEDDARIREFSALMNVSCVS